MENISCVSVILQAGGQHRERSVAASRDIQVIEGTAGAAVTIVAGGRRQGNFRKAGANQSYEYKVYRGGEVVGFVDRIDPLAVKAVSSQADLIATIMWMTKLARQVRSAMDIIYLLLALIDGGLFRHSDADREADRPDKFHRNKFRTADNGSCEQVLLVGADGTIPGSAASATCHLLRPAVLVATARQGRIAARLRESWSAAPRSGFRRSSIRRSIYAHQQVGRQINDKPTDFHTHVRQGCSSRGATRPARLSYWSGSVRELGAAGSRTARIYWPGPPACSADTSAAVSARSKICALSTEPLR